jgi:hypothetical protein
LTTGDFLVEALAELALLATFLGEAFLTALVFLADLGADYARAAFFAIV